MADALNLLVEIGTEELPPKALWRLAEGFRDGLTAGLAAAGLTHGAVTPYATPRRLALHVAALATAQPDRIEERRGPALAAAFDAAGTPTKAALGFARSCGLPAEALDRLETDKGSWLVARRQVTGHATTALLPGLVETALAGLPIPKRMRWGAREEEFVRPVHWVVLLFGEEVVAGQVLGLAAGRATRGHRFHAPGALPLDTADAYEKTLLESGFVVPDFAARRARIRAQVTACADELGGKACIDAALLDEVTALVEWPVTLAGAFDPRFLEVPAEALISTMQGNQKYFPVVSADGRLLPHFIAVSNIRSTRPETVREGNERVIRPRFADAEFFWNQDRKQTLTNLESTLDTVVYQEKLGSLRDRAARIAALAGQLCGPAEQADAELAGRLCKCDLLTNMVGEFPELQGIMGRHYAQHDGLPDAVAIAIGEHYHPRFAGDTLPESAVGRAVAVADKLDTLVGIFGIGQRPSGDRDPFALRRAALGVLRISLEGGFDLDLDAALQHAVAGYGTRLTEADTAGQVYQFLLERLRGYYAEAGFAAELFDAVAALRPAQPRDFDRRLRAVAAFLELPEATSLAAANKRIHNILRQAQTPVRADVDTALLTEPAEQALAMALAAQREAVAPDLERGDYTAALTRLAGLRGPVDRFFDDVMVMVEDPALRTNRLALLQELSGLFLRVADLSCLPG